MRFNSSIRLSVCLSVCLPGHFVLTHNDHSGQKAEQDAVCNQTIQNVCNMFPVFSNTVVTNSLQLHCMDRRGDREEGTCVCVGMCHAGARVNFCTCVRVRPGRHARGQKDRRKSARSRELRSYRLLSRHGTRSHAATAIRPTRIRPELVTHKAKPLLSPSPHVSRPRVGRPRAYL